MISVVMPAYNAEQYLVPAIESVLGQTYRDFEFIIVDDHSTDSTLEISRCYARQDSRVQVITTSHLGNGGARNAGMVRATRPWIAVMDADDIALPERLETQLEAADEDSDVVVWGSAAFHIGVDDQVLSRFQAGPGSREEFEAMRGRAESIQVIHPTAFYRRDIALRIGGYNNAFKVAADAEFFDRMALHGPVLTLPVPLMKHRLHASSLTLTRFAEQQRNADFVRDRQRRRLAGEPPISLADFKAQLRRDLLWKRVLRWQRDMQDLFYIEAGMAYGQHHTVEACRYFMLSLMVNPFFAIPKVWKSRFSAQSRSSLQSSA